MKQVNNICPDVQHVGEYPKGASYYHDGTNDLVVGKQIIFLQTTERRQQLVPSSFYPEGTNYLFGGKSYLD